MQSHLMPYSPAELARFYANQRPAISARALDIVLSARVGAVLGVFAGALTKWMERIAVRQYGVALAFERLTQEIAQRPMPEEIDASGEAVQRLIVLEADLRALAVRSQSAQAHQLLRVQRPIPRFVAAVLRAAAGASVAADAVRELRGAIMAHDANVCAMQHAQRARPALDAAQLEHDLENLTAP